MSIVEIDKVDGIALNGENCLVLLISDHLNWRDEYDHLKTLQDKINAYIAFIENLEYLDLYPDAEIKHAQIEIRAKYALPRRAQGFIGEVNRQLVGTNISVSYEKVGGKSAFK